MNWKISKCDCSERNERNVHDQIFQNSYNNNDNDEDMTKKEVCKWNLNLFQVHLPFEFHLVLIHELVDWAKKNQCFVVDICWFYGLDRIKMKSLIMR